MRFLRRFLKSVGLSPEDNQDSGAKITRTPVAPRTETDRQTVVTSLETSSSLVSFDPHLLERALSKWQFGDWFGLTHFDKEDLYNHPEREKIALLIASGHYQSGNLIQAKCYIDLARNWGASAQLAGQSMIADVVNGLGRAALLAGQPDRAIERFRSSVRINAPYTENELLSQLRFRSEDAASRKKIDSLKLTKPRADEKNIASAERLNSCEVYNGGDEEAKRLLCLIDIDAARQALVNKRRLYREWLTSNKNYYENQQDNPLVSVVMSSFRAANIDRILKNLTSQSYGNKEFIVVIERYTESDYEKLRMALCQAVDRGSLKHFEIILENSQLSLGRRQNLAIEHASGSYWAKMDDDDFYFENYLSDSVMHLRMGRYDIVGKNSVFMFLEGVGKLILRNPSMWNMSNANLRGASLVARNDPGLGLSFGDMQFSEDSHLLKDAKNRGLSIYAADPFNFAVWRKPHLDSHTWKKPESFFIENGQVLYNFYSSDVIEA